MSSPFRQKVLALAGVFQAASLADSLAWHGSCDPVAMEASLKSLLVPQCPENGVDAVFGTDPRHLRAGLQALEQILTTSKLRSPHPRRNDILRYAMMLLQLEREAAKSEKVATELKRRLELTERQMAFFRDIKDPGMIRNLAGTYVDTVGSFKLRIRLRGSKQHLTSSHIPEQIRAILLTGVRSAMLWHGLGGRRWLLPFSRGKTLREVQAIILEFHGQLSKSI